jgi:hypothetical protein
MRLQVALRKLYYGCLRFRILQISTDSRWANEALTRPISTREDKKLLSTLMMQAVTNLRMYVICLPGACESLADTRDLDASLLYRGDIEGQDAQDVRVGTVIDGITEEEEGLLGAGFLAQKQHESATDGL